MQLTGWIVDTRNEDVEEAWVDFGGTAVPVDLQRHRADVATVLGMQDRYGARVGFHASAVLPQSLAPGTYDVRVLGRSHTGTGLYSENARRVTIGYPRTVSRSLCEPDRHIDFAIRVRDTQTAPYTLGRGASTIREEASLRLSGFVEGGVLLHIVATPDVGAPVAWDIPCDPGGRFDAVLWTGGLERGCYALAIGRDEGSRVVAVARAGFDIAGPHYLPPLHLSQMFDAPLGELTSLADTGPRGSLTTSGPLIAGRPIGLSGWCLDPAAMAPPLAVYVEVDGKRPVPLSHHLADPRAAEPLIAVRCGFGGAIDTTRLDPGEHRVRTLALAFSGVGWYVIDDRKILLEDHRKRAPVAASISGEEPFRQLPKR